MSEMSNTPEVLAKSSGLNVEAGRSTKRSCCSSSRGLSERRNTGVLACRGVGEMSWSEVALMKEALGRLKLNPPGRDGWKGFCAESTSLATEVVREKGAW